MMNSQSASHWYAIQAKNHGEARVVRGLAQRTIPAFLPLIEIVRRTRGRWFSLLEPLFPGYLFVRLERIELNPAAWHAVRWTPGVRFILGEGEAGELPVPVPDEAIDAIQERVRGLGFIRPGLRFAAQDRVLIRHGPLAGLEAVFDRSLSRSGRVQVLLELLGRQSRVQVEASDLELV